jgi:hypothetical protein
VVCGYRGGENAVGVGEDLLLPAGGVDAGLEGVHVALVDAFGEAGDGALSGDLTVQGAEPCGGGAEQGDGG